ncbi:hypothetical protein M9H77_20080 [Catharanthus roseus]|uniref:Uncharacterized protein n=1 Tax=Catharanthus roseus TaxID=4058 RepID=A0ACC0AJY9_CATRO|nr:hypothetical protein M9H77_20080 [Catharanthus roseus]
MQSDNQILNTNYTVEIFTIASPFFFSPAKSTSTPKHLDELKVGIPVVNRRSPATFQLCPQQFKYITCRRDSSDCFLLSSPFPLPRKPPTSDPNILANGRRSVPSPEESLKAGSPFVTLIGVAVHDGDAGSHPYPVQKE